MSAVEYVGHNEPQIIACPTCGQPRGEGCRFGGRSAGIRFHVARVRAARIHVEAGGR